MKFKWLYIDWCDQEVRIKVSYTFPDLTEDFGTREVLTYINYTEHLFS